MTRIRSTTTFSFPSFRTRTTADAGERPRFLGWGPRGTSGASIPAQLAFEGVTQRYGDTRALDSVTLTIRPGEIVCLLGHSGCGKTTLLRVAAGVESPVEGRVLLDGREVSGPKLFLPPEQRGIGLMFQDYALFPHLTILDNVLFGLKALPAADAQVAARRALSRVGLEGYAADYPHTLSGGEQQRVALARSIAPRPGVLLMDEPFSNLDRRMRDAIRDETIAILRETGATTIVVTHDPEEAMRIADRIVLMRSGALVQQGTAEDVYRRPADLFAARFFCDFNEVEGRVRGGRVDTPIGAFPAPSMAEGEAAIVCLRPQGVRLKPPGFCLPGRVVSRRFLGEVDLVQVAVQGLDRPLQARVRAQKPVRPGEDVGVDVDPDEILVFAAGRP
ncbi:MAG TPA: ABC transporter ATP-binding protein [Beijerinckiaceae bacterium]|nr:ABC transporter ATP-binding protein [Beijerinckiaceae bacterium]